MPVLQLIASSGFGSLLGMRHALEPDHLAAVSTLVTRERGGYRAAMLGACWGAGQPSRSRLEHDRLVQRLALPVIRFADEDAQQLAFSW